MRLVIQRVTHASVTVDETVLGNINHGYVVLLGIGHNDTTETADKLIKKMLHLRIFEDENGKSNLSLSDVDGELLIISQFTLLADCRKGNRPSFINAAKPEQANQLYEYFLQKCKETVPVVQAGQFGADMKVSLLNDGPFTIILDSQME